MSLSDKVVLITGGTRGIGRAIVEAFAKAGAVVCATATTELGANKITQHLHSLGAKGAGFVLNVCDLESVSALLTDISDQFGHVAILVNNAGITQDNILVRMKSEQWEGVIDTNLSAVYRTTKACLRGMMKARFGRIINISSVVGVTGNPGQANYCAAKAGMIGFTKSVAQEMAGVGVTANVVAPGFIETDMTAALDEKQKNTILAQIPAKKMGRPEDIASAVLFLASEEAQYITGQTLHVNGGMCMI